MSCYLLAKSYESDLVQPATCTKLSCIVIDSLLLPITSIIVGVVGTVLLLIKFIFRLLTFPISQLASRFHGVTPPTTADWFSSCIYMNSYLVPLLLIPVIGTLIYCSVIAKVFKENEGYEVSCLDVAVTALGCPWEHLKNLVQKW
ncbi:hypothetical protein [Chlamydia pecorum]|uniref:hypothetical protein n=1 Tax=Chlamydia pecorum TaxID=85991 RepID=UPI0007AF2259|nr:hypothetical protein [Chlamydia pecorum]KZN26773.1 hypothetical protein cpL17_0913 [Chlamydia pecorum]